MELLKVKNLNFKSRNKNIISNINFSLNKGEVLSILGPSGSGKSTILKLLAGLFKPHDGTIHLLNNLISSNNTLAPTGERNIGLMFQEEVLFPHLTVYKNIAFGIEKLEDKDNLINKYLKNFGLVELRNNYPDSLSGGEKQRVSLARILITKPKILLMDEPFSSLDKNLRTDICDYTIKILREKKISVIFVTHDVNEAFRISNRILILKDGNVQQIDAPEKIYNFPESKYTAELVSDINQFSAKSNNLGFINTPFGNIQCKCSGRKHFCLIRPSDLYFSKRGINAKIVDRHFLGSAWEYKVFISNSFPILKIYPSQIFFGDRENIKVSIDLKKVLIFEE